MIMKFILHMAQSAGLTGAVLILYRHERWEVKDGVWGGKRERPSAMLCWDPSSACIHRHRGAVHLVVRTCPHLPVHGPRIRTVIGICLDELGDADRDPAVSEEVFCRGYVQGLLMHRFGSLAGIIGSSVVASSLWCIGIIMRCSIPFCRS